MTLGSRDKRLCRSTVNVRDISGVVSEGLRSSLVIVRINSRARRDDQHGIFDSCLDNHDLLVGDAAKSGQYNENKLTGPP